MVDKYTERVKTKIDQRAACGLDKYGVTLDRDDLSVIAWLQHLQDELLDAANYVEVLIEKNR